ncbi:MAG TPA: corrinoid-binding protein, partial [Geobacter sulfurreducens]|nr:corrinoid-binding protein [Geobacter sulfurreducens]
MEQSLTSEHEELLRLIVDADRDGANALIDRWADEHGYTNALSDLLEPVLREIGDRWGRDEISLAQGFVAGKIAEDTLTKALASA